MANLLEKASIVLTPTGYSRDVIHNVKPSGGIFGDITLIQNGTTTRVDENGLVVNNTTDIPRIDYSKGSGAILSELSSTNNVRYSEDFSNVLWLKSGVTLTSSTGTNPRGESATIYAIQAAPVQGGLEHNIASSSGYGVGVSCWVRKKSGVGTTGVEIGYGYGSSISKSILTVGADWQRITHESTGGTQVDRFYMKPVSTLNAETIEIWGAQLEKTQSFGLIGRVSSYIPSTDLLATRTRTNYLNGGDSTLIGAQEGVLFFEGAALSNAYGGRGIALSANNSAANRVVLYFDGVSNQVRTTLQAPSAFVSIIASGINQTNFNKIAVKYKSGNIALWANGTEVATSTNTFTFSADLSELAFDQGNGSQHFDGHVKQLAVFKEVLTDAELAALTS